jgi:hypothetical protein
VVGEEELLVTLDFPVVLVVGEVILVVEQGIE